MRKPFPDIRIEYDRPTRDAKINISKLPKTNIFRKLIEPASKHNDGVIRNVICVFGLKNTKVGYENLRKDIVEFASVGNFSSIFKIKKDTSFDMCNRGNSLLIIDITDFKNKKRPYYHPALISLLTIGNKIKKISLIVLSDTFIPKIWDEADLVYAENNIKGVGNFREVRINEFILPKDFSKKITHEKDICMD